MKSLVDILLNSIKSDMKIIYFDEVKYDPPTQPYFWIGAIAIDANDIQEIEKKLDSLAFKTFASLQLTRQTEFHASDIFHRKNHFKHEKDHAKRRLLLQDLSDMCSSEKISRIYVRIEPGRMHKHPSEIPSMAFMLFAEQVDSYLKSVNDIGLLIGDRESDYVSKEFANALAQYRSKGTLYDYGTKVERLVDTVHFTESHLSRLLQLADAFIWLFQFSHQNKETKYSKQLHEYIATTKLKSISRCKVFPTNLSRIQVNSFF